MSEESHARDVIQRMRSYSKRMTEIMDLIGDNQRLSPADKERIQGLYTSLKADLKADYKRGDTKRGQEEMTKIEKAYFHPAIHEAYCDLRAATNSHPINSNWRSELYAAHFDIGHLLSQLESQYPE